MNNLSVNKKKSSWGIFLKTRGIQLVFLLAIVIICGSLLARHIFAGESSDIRFEKSSGVKANYISKITQQSKSTNLVPLTETQIFEECNTSILKGVVTKIQNIKVVIGGEVDYRSIITVRIQKVFRGDEKVDSEITILCPMAITGDYEAEDNEVLSKLKVNSVGIFMPEKYRANSIEEGGKGEKLYLSELAKYGFMDGMRFAFIESDNGIVYEEQTFRSLKQNPTFNDIEKYINIQLKCK